ncbi:MULTISPECIES: hypothetical protein [Nostocales]|uniref:Uncharacterized protein n=3 Tax=Nostocales TaxID=1161 RepID=A0A8S9SVC6_9CYAN|nr:hypothetical protein [Tolypothrix bouteillei]KAF3884441.1 hypothetical protein DA73_0400002345 [Tolypothrix bouteillei VB521301]
MGNEDNRLKPVASRFIPWLKTQGFSRSHYVLIGLPDRLDFTLFGSTRVFIFVWEGVFISVLSGALRTSQKRTQLNLRKLQVSEAKFRRLVDSNIIGVIFLESPLKCCEVYTGRWVRRSSTSRRAW